MPKKKKEKVRFELQLDASEDAALRDLEKKSGLCRADVVRQLIRRANASEVIYAK